MADRSPPALSVRQPFAWLIVHGYKPIENRDWPTRVRGSVLIHTGQRFDREGYEWVRATFPEIPMPHPSQFERGGVVGRARITDCVQEHSSPWFFGTHGFVMEGAEPIPFIPGPGQLGFFRFVPTEAPHA